MQSSTQRQFSHLRPADCPPPQKNKGIPMHDLWEYTIFRHQTFLPHWECPPKYIIYSFID
jgi:hypothetical protein